MSLNCDISEKETLNGYSEFLLACLNNHIEIIKHLISVGYEMNETDLL